MFGISKVLFRFRKMFKKLFWPEANYFQLVDLLTKNKIGFFAANVENDSKPVIWVQNLETSKYCNLKIKKTPHNGVTNAIVVRKRSFYDNQFL